MSLSGGTWFVLSSGPNVIRVWGSSLSGLERVYVDEALVSERRSLGRVSLHEFSLDGQQHCVAIAVKHLGMQLECVWTIEGVPVKKLRTFVDTSRALSPKLVASAAAVAIFSGAISALFRFPPWLSCVLIAAMYPAIVRPISLGVEEVAI